MSPAPAESEDQISFLQEVERKATHMFALVIPAGYQILGLSKGDMLTIMVPIAIFTIAVDISRLRNGWLWRTIFRHVFGHMIRSHEQNGDFTGATYIFISVVAAVALFTKPIAVAALSFIIVGDTLAALVGRRLGKHKFIRAKTVEGTTACLIGTVLVALLVPDLALSVGLTGAVVAALIEAMPLGLDDNVSVPLIAGLVMTVSGILIQYLG